MQGERIAATAGQEGSDLFEALIAPLDRETFLREYFNRDLLLARGADDRFASLIGWPDIDRALEYGRLAARLSLVRRGKTIAPPLYTRERAGQRVLDAGAVTMLLSQGATMIANFVEETFPRVRALADGVEEALDAHVNVNLYAGWRTDAGFDLHFDHHDVLVLQVAGRKRWRIHTAGTEYPVRNSRYSSTRPAGDPDHDFELTAGDVLFIPRGWWHEAVPLDGESLHLTIAITPPIARNLMDYVAGCLEAHPLGRRDVPPRAMPGERAQYFADLLALIETEFADGISDRFAHAREAERIAQPRFRLARVGPPAFAIADGTPVRLAAERRVHIAGVANGVVRFSVSNRHWECDAALLPAIAALRSYRSFPFRDLASLLPDAALVGDLRTQLTMLAAAGALFLDERE